MKNHVYLGTILSTYAAALGSEEVLLHTLRPRLHVRSLSLVNDDVECLALRAGKMLTVVVYRPLLGKKKNLLRFFEAMLCDSTFN